MKVYISYHAYAYERDDVIGIFSNLESAIACCRARYEDKKDKWSSSERLPLSQGHDSVTAFEAFFSGDSVCVKIYQVSDTFGG